MMAMNSTPSNSNKAEVLPKVNTKKNTEWTGLFLEITKSAVIIAPKPKAINI